MVSDRFKFGEQGHGAAISFSEAVMVSGSFDTGGRRWAADVDGKPVGPVRSNLDIGCTTPGREPFVWRKRLCA